MAVNRIPEVFQNSALLFSEFAKWFFQRTEALLDKKDFITISLSGGSTPENFFSELKDNFKDRVQWNRRFYECRCIVNP